MAMKEASLSKRIHRGTEPLVLRLAPDSSEPYPHPCLCFSPSRAQEGRQGSTSDVCHTDLSAASSLRHKLDGSLDPTTTSRYPHTGLLRHSALLRHFHDDPAKPTRRLASGRTPAIVLPWPPPALPRRLARSDRLREVRICACSALLRPFLALSRASVVQPALRATSAEWMNGGSSLC